MSRKIDPTHRQCLAFIRDYRRFRLVDEQGASELYDIVLDRMYPPQTDEIDATIAACDKILKQDFRLARISF